MQSNVLNDLAETKRRWKEKKALGAMLEHVDAADCWAQLSALSETWKGRQA